MKQHHKVIYYSLLTSGKLNSHLADTEEQAQELFLPVVKKLAEKEGVDEKPKAENQMEWVRRINSVRNRATGIVNTEVVFAQDETAGTKYGLRHIRFHDLRHTFASILNGQDVPLINVSNFLGHSDLSTTANIYAHLDKASKQASADIMTGILNMGKS